MARWKQYLQAWGSAEAQAYYELLKQRFKVQIKARVRLDKSSHKTDDISVCIDLSSYNSRLRWL
jgi:hypothetical protein